MAHTIAFLNKKGGVGKTSTCHHLAGTLARQGRRVLLLDADPQASLTQGFWGPEAMRAIPGESSVAALFDPESEPIPAALIRPSGLEGIDLVPGSEALTPYNHPDTGRWARHQGGMRDFLAEARDGYDLVLIDCPPNLHLCSWAALVAADAVVVPLQAEDYGAQGIASVQEAVAAVRSHANPTLHLLGYLITMFDKRLGVHTMYEGTLRQLYGADVFTNAFPLAKDYKEAVAARLPISHYKPKSAAAKATAAVAGELLEALCGNDDEARVGRGSEGRLMSAVKDKLTARFGGNVMESMGAGRAGGFTLPTSGAIPEESTKYQGCTRIKSALLIQVDRVVPDPNQPRKEFEPESLRQLADSLKERGQLQPIRVRWDAAMESWVIIAGERRWRAAAQAGLPTITAVEATKPLTEDEILEEQLIENCVREDLRPIEQARAYKALIDSRGISQRQLAEKLRIAQATVAKTLALLTLPGEIQASVDASEIGPAEAYQLSRIDSPEEQAVMAREVKAGRLNRDDIEERTRATRKSRGSGRGKAKKVTSRTFKTASGPRVTVEFKKGLDGSSVVAAGLREALQLAEGRPGVDGQVAA